MATGSSQVLLTLQATLSTLLAVWFAALGWGVTGQFVALACGIGVAQGLLVLVSHRRFPGLRVRGAVGSQEDPDVRLSLRTLNRPAFVLQLSGMIGLLSDSVIIALFLNPSLVMAFFLTQRLASIAQVQVQDIGTASWAALAEIHARGELELFRVRALELTRLVAIGALALLVPIAVFNEVFVGLWVGPELYGGAVVTVAASLVVFGQAVVSLWGWFFHAAGQLPKLVPLSIGTVAVNLIASILCVRLFRLAGPLLGTLVSFILVSSWAFPALIRRSFGIPVRRLLGALALPVLVSLPVAIGALWLRELAAVQFWPGWLGGTAAIYLLLAWFALFTGEERRTWRKRMEPGIDYLRR